MSKEPLSPCPAEWPENKKRPAICKMYRQCPVLSCPMHPPDTGQLVEDLREGERGNRDNFRADGVER